MTTAAGSLDILTWNVFLRPPLVVRDRQAERAEKMPSHLMGAEVIVLNEAFDDASRRKVVAGLSSTHPYVSEVPGRDRGLKQDGGIMVLSRWPIEAKDTLVYADCSGNDCWADKGVSYAAVRKAGRLYHVFATHLQAQDASVRQKQLRALADFVTAKAIPRDEAVFFAGDFNVDRGSAEYFQMLKMLTASCPAPRGHPYTSDPQNDLVPDTRPPSFIDYVLYSNQHRQPRESSLEPRIFRDTGALSRDLSDHYAVLGRLLF
jgi:endonuclease/exonuclease/phosphatase family metal-dependent hydrolase